MFGKGRFGGGMIFKTEVVNGICPTCTSNTVFVSICTSVYRCTNCGSDLEQKLTPDESGEGSIDEPFQIVSESFEMPVEMNIGLSYEAIPGLLIQGTFNNNSSSNNELRFGSEYGMSFGNASVWIGSGLSIANIDDEKPDNMSQADWSESTDSNFGLNPIYPNPLTSQEWGPFGNSYRICYQYSTPFDSTWSNFSVVDINIVSTSSEVSARGDSSWENWIGSPFL